MPQQKLKIVTAVTCKLFGLFYQPLSLIIVHQTHYEKSDWSRAFNQFTIGCELDMINAISAWLLSPLECSPQKQNG